MLAGSPSLVGMKLSILLFFYITAALVIASPNYNKKSRLFVIDRKNEMHLLVEFDALISSTRRRRTEFLKQDKSRKLIAVNGTPICTYGDGNLTLDIGLKRTFEWTLTITDINSNIVESDFLGHYGFRIDLRNKYLIDSSISSKIRGYV